MRAVIYTRVSPSPKTRASTVGNLSLDAQLTRCREHAARKGYKVIGEFSDPALSGKDALAKRPGLQAVLGVASRKEDVVVIVYSLSRLSRRQSITWALLDDRGEHRLQVESASEPFDTSTPMGRAMLGMLGVWSQLEADMCSERTSAALEARRARGLPLGAKPLSAERPETVALVAELYSSGSYTHASLAAELNSRGVATMRGARWHATTVSRTLKQNAE